MNTIVEKALFKNIEGILTESKEGIVSPIKNVTKLNWNLYRDFVNNKKMNYIEAKAQTLINPIVKGVFNLTVEQKVEDLTEPEVQKIIDQYRKNNEPALWVFSHSHRNDISTGIINIKQHVHLLFGGLGQTMINLDVNALALNGAIMLDRTSNSSRQSIEGNVKHLKKYNIGTYMAAEGNFNDSPNVLVQDLYNSPYIFGKETGMVIFPQANYWDPTTGNIYIKNGSPLSTEGKTQEEFMRELRDTLATLIYEIILEKNLHLNREELGENPMDYFIKTRTCKQARPVHHVRELFTDEFILKTYPDELTGIRVKKELSNVKIDKNNAYLAKGMMEEKQLIDEYDKYNVTSVITEEIFGERIDIYEYNRLSYRYKKNSAIITKKIIEFYKSSDMEEVINYLLEEYQEDFAARIKEFNIIDSSLDKLYYYYPIDMPEWVEKELESELSTRKKLNKML